MLINVVLVWLITIKSRTGKLMKEQKMGQCITRKALTYTDDSQEHKDRLSGVINI